MKANEHLLARCPAPHENLAVRATFVGVLHDIRACLVSCQFACEDLVFIHAGICAGRANEIQHERQLVKIAGDEQFCHEELACG